MSDAAVSSSSVRATLCLAARQALQWRLLLLWWAGLSLPALLLFLPLWRALASFVDHSLRAPQLASGFSLPLIAEMVVTLVQQAGTVLPAVGLAGLALTLLLSPWLTGLAVTAARQPAPQGFGALLRGGLADYGRLFRITLWALLPLGLAIAIGVGLNKAAGHHAEQAVLEASAGHWETAATLIAVLLVLLANATVDAGRAQFVLQMRKRSAVKAGWRGLRVLAPRHWRSVLSYLLITLAGLVLLAVFSWLRLQAPGLLVPAWHLPGWLGTLIALLAGQAAVLALAWMRCARLFALVAQGRAAG
ncbi:hypothetical protein LRH25_08390 [Ideonella azotifigens]|uniref:Uncharacterized protein n=1 Tax=Ideonella azotifigens TaxID=513160 RepID=A0ABN1KGJ5_9BURK|nr:hypothetical protein [Ideonella azotifigens]MCD2340360.1 hypothetical protein [Ideonella azotifigens]